MEELLWMFKWAVGPVETIQILFFGMGMFHLLYAGWHVEHHPTGDYRVDRRWGTVFNSILRPIMYAWFFLPFLMPLAPASLLFVAMPLVAIYYRSRDAAGMWGGWAILGFYILFMLVAVYGFDAMEPYRYHEF